MNWGGRGARDWGGQEALDWLGFHGLSFSQRHKHGRSLSLTSHPEHAWAQTSWTQNEQRKVRK
jgi:hypothetical protein